MRCPAWRGPLIAVLLVTVGSAAGCGGSQRPKPPPPPPEEEIVSIPVRKVEKEPEPPPPPQEWYARAELAPVKRAKMKRGVVKFWQVEGEAMSLTGAFDGLKPGRYHFVIHEGAECGKNATQAGPAWSVATGVPMPVEVVKNAPGPIEMADLALMLDGESTIVGRTLVLHADRKGRPHKAVACGVIAPDEPPPAEAEAEEGAAEEGDAEGAE